MSTSPVEKLALAIFEAKGGTWWDNRSSTVRQKYYDLARKILDESSEPVTDETTVDRAKIKEALKIFADADAERLKETEDAHDEAREWKSDGDMYGWNFHEGRASGVTMASIIFHRVKRFLENL